MQEDIFVFACGLYRLDGGAKEAPCAFSHLISCYFCTSYVYFRTSCFYVLHCVFCFLPCAAGARSLDFDTFARFICFLRIDCAVSPFTRKYRNTAFPKHLHRQPTPTLNTQGKMPCNPLVGPPTCKLVGDKSIFFGQLPLGSGFQSRSTHGIDPAANPRRRTEFPSHDDSHNVSSLVDDIANSYSTFRCDQNESRRPLSSTCTDIETAGSC